MGNSMADNTQLNAYHRGMRLRGNSMADNIQPNANHIGKCLRIKHGR